MFVSCSIGIFQTRLIKKLFDTSISELSNDGTYNFNPYPEIFLHYPMGDEKFFMTPESSSIEIAWKTELPSYVPYVTIAYATSENSYTDIETVDNSGYYLWLLDSNKLKDSNTYRVKVYANYTIRTGTTTGAIIEKQATTDAESNEFSVVFRYLRVLPIGTGLEFDGGTEEELSVPFIANQTSDFVKIEVYDVATQQLMKTLNEKYYVQGSTNSYSVKMKDLQFFEDVTLRVRITDTSDESIYSESDPFRVLFVQPPVASEDIISSDPYFNSTVDGATSNMMLTSPNPSEIPTTEQPSDGSMQIEITPV